MAGLHKYYLLLVGLLVFGMVNCSLTGSGDGESKFDGPDPLSCEEFKNPIMAGADPWVVKKDGFYYFIKSEGGALHVSKSEKLTEPREWVRVWTQPEDGWNQTNLWAPELHYLDGKWYIYYAAGRSGPPFINQRAGVLESASKNPRGEYIDRGMLYTGDRIETRSNNKWAIDMTILKQEGQLYAIWSGWKKNRNDDGTPQHQYIASMSDPTTISSNRVLISSPTRSWETAGPLNLNEGATVLRSRNTDRLFVIYSTGQSWLPSYKLGQLELKPSDADPMNPDNWIKEGPVFTGTDEVHGVGHASFTTSPDGTQDWIVYHSKKDTSPGWDRTIRTQQFHWREEGEPDFGTPIPTTEILSAPSGECE